MMNKIKIKLENTDFQINYHLLEHYGNRLMASQHTGGKVTIFWWDGTPTEGKWYKVGEGKIETTATLPTLKSIEKVIAKIVKRRKE